MKMKSLIILATGLILGSGSAALAGVGGFSIPMTNDLYNGNTPNTIPTPYFTPGLKYNLFDAVNLLSKGALTLTTNQQLDPKYTALDNVWNLKSSTATIFVIGRSAKNQNDIGIYPLGGAAQPPLLSGVTGFDFFGDGSLAKPFVGRDFTLLPNSDFGFYIKSWEWKTNFTTSTTFYSQPARNPDLYDHIVGYTVGEMAEIVGQKIWIQNGGDLIEHTITDNALLLGLKDRVFNTYAGWPYPGTLGDDDFNDIMLLVDSPDVLPIPDPNPVTVPEPATLTLVVTGLAGLFFYGRRNRT